MNKLKLSVLLLMAVFALSSCQSGDKPNHIPKTGKVVAEFTINEQGHVEDIQIISSTNPVFNGPVITAMKTWRFKPAIHNGTFKRIRAQQAFEFDSNEGPKNIQAPPLSP